MHPIIARRKLTKIWVRGPFRLIMFDETYPIFLLHQTRISNPVSDYDQFSDSCQETSENPGQTFFLAPKERPIVEMPRKFVPDLTFTGVP
jgi:hypothetical protein